MQYSKEEIGKKIKEKRNNMNYSQDDLGKKLGLQSRAKQISKYEKGLLYPPMNVLLELCNIFDCELGYLLGEDDYAYGTKLYTEIEKKTGLTPKSVEKLQNDVIGMHNTHFGYRSREYKGILNSIISCDEFIEIIDQLADIDALVQKHKTGRKELDERYGADNVNKAANYIANGIDEFNDDGTDPELNELHHNLINDVQKSMQEESNFSYTVKVLRYGIYETLTNLLDRLYPTD